MNPRLRSILIGIGLLTLVIIAIVLIPRGLSLYYQSRGGQHIDYVMRSVEGIQELVCEPLPESNRGAIEEVEQGIEDLQRAVRFNRRSAHAYYQLGKAYCLLGEPDDALKSYQQYTVLRPDNPLGHIGLGFAIISKWIQDSPNSIQSTNITDYQNIDELLIAATYLSQNSKVTAEEISEFASSMLYEGDLNKAFSYFLVAKMINEKISNESKFLLMLASVIILPDMGSENLSGVPNLLRLDDSLNINSSNLIWIEPYNVAGKPMMEYPSSNPEVGAMWWEGRVGFFLWTEDEGSYKISFQAIHRDSEKGEIQVERNLIMISDFEIDQSWQDYSTEVLFPQGLSFVSIRYIDGMGDLLIDKFRIEEKHNQ